MAIVIERPGLVEMKALVRLDYRGDGDPRVALSEAQRQNIGQNVSILSIPGPQLDRHVKAQIAYIRMSLSRDKDDPPYFWTRDDYICYLQVLASGRAVGYAITNTRDAGVVNFESDAIDPDFRNLGLYSKVVDVKLADIAANGTADAIKAYVINPIVMHTMEKCLPDAKRSGLFENYSMRISGQDLRGRYRKNLVVLLDHNKREPPKP